MRKSPQTANPKIIIIISIIDRSSGENFEARLPVQILLFPLSLALAPKAIQAHILQPKTSLDNHQQQQQSLTRPTNRFCWQHSNARRREKSSRSWLFYFIFFFFYFMSRERKFFEDESMEEKFSEIRQIFVLKNRFLS